MHGHRDLKVRLADAQGLRLMCGGEIRLVLTLCAAGQERRLSRDDLKGFQLKNRNVRNIFHVDF